MFQALELLNAALNVGAMGVVFFIEIAELGLELRAESTEAPRPAVVPADDGGVH